MTTGPNTGRLSTTEAARRALDLAEAMVARSTRVPTFGITDERGPGGIVIPLFRCEIPVCDEFPDSGQAYAAALGYYSEFRLKHPVGAQEAAGNGG